MKKFTWLIAGLGVILSILFTSTPSLAQTCQIANGGQCVLESSEDSSEGTSSDEPSDDSSTVTPGTPESVEALAERLYALVNSERAKVNLPALDVQPWAESMASEHSVRMAGARSIWHNDDYFANGRRAMGSNFLGENVGMGVSVEGAHQSLMESPPHRQNILDSRFDHLGIGIARDEDGMIYVTEGFARIPAVTSAGAPSPRTTSKASAESPAELAPASESVTVSVVIDGTEAAAVPNGASELEAAESLVLSANSANSTLNMIAVAMWLFVAASMVGWRSRLYLRNLALVRARTGFLLRNLEQARL
ncbi:MAG: CAP domain-containing protein [Actinobacteria bacterium]|nr:CAP domain-containing protein [Actinomycetota bacterium]